LLRLIPTEAKGLIIFLFPPYSLIAPAVVGEKHTTTAYAPGTPTAAEVLIIN